MSSSLNFILNANGLVLNVEFILPNSSQIQIDNKYDAELDMNNDEIFQVEILFSEFIQIWDIDIILIHRNIEHYIDVIMTTMASQITSLTVVYSSVCSDADQRKHQSSASLAFVWGIHRDR